MDYREPLDGCCVWPSGWWNANVCGKDATWRSVVEGTCVCGHPLESQQDHRWGRPFRSAGPNCLSGCRYWTSLLAGSVWLNLPSNHHLRNGGRGHKTYRTCLGEIYIGQMTFKSLVHSRFGASSDTLVLAPWDDLPARHSVHGGLAASQIERLTCCPASERSAVPGSFQGPFGAGAALICDLCLLFLRPIQLWVGRSNNQRELRSQFVALSRSRVTNSLLYSVTPLFAVPYFVRFLLTTRQTLRAGGRASKIESKWPNYRFFKPFFTPLPKTRVKRFFP